MHFNNWSGGSALHLFLFEGEKAALLWSSETIQITTLCEEVTT